MPHDLIGPLEPATFLAPAEVVARLMSRFDQVLVSRWEGQRNVRNMPRPMQELIDVDNSYVVVVQQGDPAAAPQAEVALEVFGEGDLTVVYRDESHREASQALLGAIETALGYGKHD